MDHIEIHSRPNILRAPEFFAHPHRVPIFIPFWGCASFFTPKVLEEAITRGGGGGTSLWVRRGCAPVLGSFWPENSGIGVSFYWKISVIGVYFHSAFSGIGVYCYYTQNSVMGIE